MASEAEELVSALSWWIRRVTPLYGERFREDREKNGDAVSYVALQRAITAKVRKM